MELKWHDKQRNNKNILCSNRTFMELKFWSRWLYYLCRNVLIAPLWNWNRYCQRPSYHPPYVLIAPLWNWNFLSRTSKADGISVLIAPLWNWNGRRRNTRGALLAVLIAPLWNWNVLIFSFFSCRPPVLIAPLWNWNTRHWGLSVSGWTRSNRTFMELKYLLKCSDSNTWITF